MGSSSSFVVRCAPWTIFTNRRFVFDDWPPLIKNNSCHRFRRVINTSIVCRLLDSIFTRRSLASTYTRVQRVDKRAWSRSLVHREEYTFENGEPISALEKTAICFTDTSWLSIVYYEPNCSKEAGGDEYMSAIQAVPDWPDVAFQS